MFHIENIYSKEDTTLVVSYGEMKTDFIISSIISKRNKDELADARAFSLINGYLDYKGDEFKKNLFDLYTQVEQQIFMEGMKKDLHPLPTGIFAAVLDMFNLDDVFHYVKNVFQLRPPGLLADEFDTMIESDGRGTRVQTYLKDDYLALAAFSTVVKAIVGPIGHYAYVRSKDITGLHKDYILFHLIKRHPIFKSEPCVKLFGLIEKLVDLPTNPDDTDNIRILEKQLPKEEIPVYILANVIIQKISIDPLVTDTDTSHIVTKVYNYVNSKLKNKGDLSKTLQQKTAFTDTDSGTGDKESIAESTRVIENIPEGIIIELNWSLDNIDKIMSQLPNINKKYIDPEVLNDGLNYTKVFERATINKCQIDILFIIFKDVIDPRAIDYISIDHIIKLMAIGFAYLWGLGYKELALLLISIPDDSNNDTITINLSSTKARLSKETKELLDYYFPYKRVINEKDNANLVEETLTNLTSEYYNVKWLNTAEPKYLEAAYGNVERANTLPSDLKSMLAGFIIDHEKLRYIKE